MPETKTRTSSNRALKSRLIYWLLRSPLAGALVHRHRQLDFDLRVEVADRPTLGVRQAEAAKSDLGSVLRLGRHVELHATALQSRRGHLAALERDVQRH